MNIASTRRPRCSRRSAATSATLDWLVLDQRRIDLFADATDDRRGSIVDPRSRARGRWRLRRAWLSLPSGWPTSSCPSSSSTSISGLASTTAASAFAFPRRCAPARAAMASWAGAEPVKGAGVQVTVRITIEIEGGDKPGCVVDTVSRLYFE